MKNLIIFGTKNFADMAYYFFSTDSAYRVAGFTVSNTENSHALHHNLPVISYKLLAQHFPPETTDIFVAIGISSLNEIRQEITAKVAADGYTLASFISSLATIHGDFIATQNTMIMDHCILHPGVTIAANTIVWSSSRIALKTHISENCWITAATIGESTFIGNNTFVGLNATIAPCLNIGRYNLIGAGALITADTKDNQIYKGSSAQLSKVSSQRIKKLSILS